MVRAPRRDQSAGIGLRYRMNVKIRLMNSAGLTATLTHHQAQAVAPIFKRMLAGGLSLRMANDMMINKLERMKTPVQFPEAS